MRIRRPLCPGPESFRERTRLLLRCARLTNARRLFRVQQQYRSFCLRVSGAVAPSALFAAMPVQSLPIPHHAAALAALQNTLSRAFFVAQDGLLKLFPCVSTAAL